FRCWHEIPRGRVWHGGVTWQRTGGGTAHERGRPHAARWWARRFVWRVSPVGRPGWLRCSTTATRRWLRAAATAWRRLRCAPARVWCPPPRLSRRRRAPGDFAGCERAPWQHPSRRYPRGRRRAALPDLKVLRECEVLRQFDGDDAGNSPESFFGHGKWLGGNA